MEEINNFQQEPDENLYQSWERFKELLMKCPQHYLTEMHEVILFYNGLGNPTRQILYSRGAIPSKTAADVRKSRSFDGCCHQNQGASIKTLEIQIGKMRKVLHERGFGSLPSSTEADGEFKSSRFQLLLKLIHTQYTILDPPNTSYLLDKIEKKGSYGPQFSEAYPEASHTIPRKEKDPGSFTLPCFINNVCFDNALVDLGASFSVMSFSTYLNLGLGELAHTKLTVELADRTVKYPKGIAKNVLVGIGKFVFPVDFIILDMPEDIKVPLILGRSFLSTARAKIDVYKRKITLRDYFKLNDLNEPYGLRRNQGDDLMPTIEEGEKDKMVYKGNNVVGALMKVLFLSGTFSVGRISQFRRLWELIVIDGMGEFIVGEHF
ncbi:hypothetical protein Tco_1353551 [Tanacetum coccineum]